MANNTPIAPRAGQQSDRAAIYARVSDKSQDGEDKTSISEQISARWKPTARARG